MATLPLTKIDILFAEIAAGDSLFSADAGFYAMYGITRRITVAIEVAYIQREEEVIQKTCEYLDAPNNELRIVSCVYVQDLRAYGFDPEVNLSRKDGAFSCRKKFTVISLIVVKFWKELLCQT